MRAAILSLSAYLLWNVPPVAWGADTPAESPSRGVSRPRSYQSGNWRVWRTENFRVCTLDRKCDLSELAVKCEELKQHIETVWFEDASGERAWEPPCDLIVHATLRDYQRALGAEVGDSIGVTTIEYDRGRVKSRRVDLRIDADGWRIDTLPHELTHVVTADRFGNRPLPPWLDEGIGVLSESSTFRGQRVEAYEAARRRGTIYQAQELITLRSFPQPDYRDAFYVQSAALVQLLRERGGSEQFTRFARRALDAGADRALRETYQIAGVGELQNWLRAADTGRLVGQGGPLTQVATLMAEGAE